MNNLPEIRLGLAAVSRDCFPIELSRRRRDRVKEACKEKGIPILVLPTIVENEVHVGQVLQEARDQDINALVIFLGNFGPEGPTSMLAQRFAGPVLLAAAAEESQKDLVQGRGDAYCGMLNASYSIGLRRLRPHIPEYPVGNAEEVADKIADFVPAARVVLGTRSLKIFAFGPRPQDFYACNAPIRPLFDLGVEVMENSELDLYDIFRKAEGHPDVKSTASDMAQELGAGNKYPDLLNKLAQYEVALCQFMEQNLGAARFGVFANKCWPAFEEYFGFVPCYINSRLATRGIPVACEVDIYGALSEYLATCATQLPATLLDINNTVPYDMFEEAKDKVGDYRPSDLFMGFHCGNTSSTCLVVPEIFSPQPKRSSAPTSPRERCWISPPAPSAASGYLPCPRWAASTGMC